MDNDKCPPIYPQTSIFVYNNNNDFNKNKNQPFINNLIGGDNDKKIGNIIYI